MTNIRMVEIFFATNKHASLLIPGKGGKIYKIDYSIHFRRQMFPASYSLELSM